MSGDGRAFRRWEESSCGVGQYSGDSERGRCGRYGGDSEEGSYSGRYGSDSGEERHGEACSRVGKRSVYGVNRDSEPDRRQEWRDALREAFQAPPPQRKQAFLRDIRHRKISACQLILQQAAYIRKWVWVLSFGVFLAAFLGGYILEKDVLWLLSAMMPFLAVSAVTEYVRPEVHGMTELEMATRLGLKSIVLARVGVMGIVHLGTLCLISLGGYREGITVFQTGIYLLAPYMLTDALSLWLVRKLRGREAIYACLGLAVIVGILPVTVKYAGIRLWQVSSFGWWLWASAVLCAVTAFEWKRNMERTEELTWN